MKQFMLITRVNGKSASRQARRYETLQELQAGAQRAFRKGKTNFWLFDGDQLIHEVHNPTAVTELEVAE